MPELNKRRSVVNDAGTNRLRDSGRSRGTSSPPSAVRSMTRGRCRPPTAIAFFHACGPEFLVRIEPGCSYLFRSNPRVRSMGKFLLGFVLGVVAGAAGILYLPISVDSPRPYGRFTG